MKINVKNEAKVMHALAEVNGKADTHTFSRYWEIEDAVSDAEKALAGTLLPQSEWQGAVFYAESGDKLPGAYKYRATTTVIELLRGSSSWFITDIKRSTIYPGQTPLRRLSLTKKQADSAISRFYVINDHKEVAA